MNYFSLAKTAGFFVAYTDVGNWREQVRKPLKQRQ
ncbi:MAG: hypothetical protein ACJAZJ_000779 [Candidatus Endobugula sp.]|jgi:hypothetical protein